MDNLVALSDGADLILRSSMGLYDGVAKPDSSATALALKRP